MAKKKGRPRENEKAQADADEVSMQQIKERTLSQLRYNPLSGTKRKGQQRAPRSFTKALLPEVAERLKKPVGTVKRHFYEHGTDSMKRFVEQINVNLAKIDQVRRELIAERDRATARGDVKKIIEITERIKGLAEQMHTEVFPKK